MKLTAPTTYRRFSVSDRARFGLEELIVRLEKRKFTSLEAAVEADESWGWITQEHLLDVRFDLDKCVRDPYFVFALRYDKRSVPQNLVRAHLKIEEFAHRQATGKAMRPADRRDHKEQIVQRLKEKTMPRAMSAPVVWQPRKQRVYFGSTSARLNELFKPWFEETFELALTVLSPAALAESLAGGEQGLAVLEALLPTRFSGEAPAVAGSSGGVSAGLSERRSARPAPALALA